MSVKQQSVGSLKKGSYIVIDDVACKVSDVSVSRPGKHGHAKVNLSAVGLLDGKKRNLTAPGHDSVDVPVIDKRNAQVLSISGDTANVMDMETYDTFDMTIPEELKGNVMEGSTVLYWQVLDDKVMKEIKGE
ncbi:MAG: translation initiation factor IF-5A [Candidatus Woesearchaeota archaeon]